MTAPGSARRASGASRTPRVRTVLLVAVAVLVIWCVIGAIGLLRARSRAQAGIDRLERAQSTLRAADLLRGDGLDTLRRANADFAAAHSSTGWAITAPLRILPVVGRQVRSVDALAGAAERVTAVGARATDRAQRAVAEPAEAGPARLALVERLAAIGDDARRDLEGIDLGPSDALIGPLASGRARFDEQLDDIRRATTELRLASTGLRRVLTGPTRYLVFGASNAEMRSGSGTWLSAGVLTFRDGRFELGEMRTSTAYLPEPPIEPTGDLAARWSWSRPGADYRNLGLSPQFPDNARLATEMWRRATGEQVDGVLVLDPVALQALLRATGPVTVDDREISADNVIPYLLVDQYRGLEYDLANPKRTEAEQTARRAGLARVARAVIGALDTSGWSAPDLVGSLQSAAADRHVLAWSGDPVQQRGWDAAGVDGVLPRDALLLSLDNLSANKLDPFMRIDAEVTGRAAPAGSRRVRIDVTVRNEAPDGLGTYAAGPFPGAGFAAGEYGGLLSFEVPRYAADVRLEGTGGIQADGAEGTTRVIAGSVRIARGASVRATLSFTLPAGGTRLSVRGSARVPATEWRVGAERFTDDAVHPIRP
ncbi:MAG: DUF4012 domain-containing protein [Actinomycetota bacterium]